MRCENCLYRRDASCHRWPPRSAAHQRRAGDYVRVAVWPVVSTDDWCGEWAPAPDAPAPEEAPDAPAPEEAPDAPAPEEAPDAPAPKRRRRKKED